ncbi:MerR family transcriptional regulator, partial [Saccharomonospora halophila]|uniref:MerR family transcriptional regulator n=1 Tax=Saccharomonospora halophila TaxID=129922 RepID=UPI000585C0B6
MDHITDTGLDNIGTFARRVGLTPSALRFYDDCGVLPPTRTDPGTGYRYYGPDQEQRAVLLRTLRDAEVPLSEVSAVLDGPGADAEEILQAHGDRLRTRAAHAH